MKKSKDRCPERTTEQREEPAGVGATEEKTPGVEAGPAALGEGNSPAVDAAEVAARQLASACAACESPESIAAYQELWKELNFIGTLDGHDVAFPEGSAKKVLPGKVYALFLELRSYAKHESPLYGSFRKVYGVFWVEGLSYRRAEFLDAYPIERIQRLLSEAEKRLRHLDRFFYKRWEEKTFPGFGASPSFGSSCATGGGEVGNGEAPPASWVGTHKCADGLNSATPLRELPKDETQTAIASIPTFARGGRSSWEVSFEGVTRTVQDCEGMEQIRRLLEAPNPEDFTTPLELLGSGIPEALLPDDGKNAHEAILDREGRQKLIEALETVRGKIAARCGSPEEQEELEQQRAFLERELKNSRYRARDKTIGTRTPAARSAEVLRKRFMRVLGKLRAEGLEELAEHLEKHIDRRRSGWAYRPPQPAPEWRVLPKH